MTIPDPHPGRCHWNGEEDQTTAPWSSLLDWAVYHSAGWKKWQAYREGLVGTPMEHRADWVQIWWNGVEESRFASDQLAGIVRCVNYLRSLRGQFAEHPELRELLDRLTPELESRWREGACGPWLHDVRA